MQKFGISIPTYNEATNINKLLVNIYGELSDIRDFTAVILVVDDNSPDGTADLVRTFIKHNKHKNIITKILVRSAKDGFGRACVAGFKKLIDENVEFIIQMDADMSHDPVYLPAFLRAQKDGHEFVVASRYIKGGQTPDWPWYRKLLSRYGNYYAKTILSNDISDYTGGFNMFSTKILKKIDLDTLQASGYGFLIELKYRAFLNAKSVSEIPIVFRDRRHGQSKIPKNTLLKNLVLVPRLKMYYSKKSFTKSKR